MKSQCITLITIMFILTPATLARAKALPTQPIEHFTRSLSAFYVALKKCVDVNHDPKKIESDIGRIRQYVATLYPEGIPYWALPEGKDQIEDADICNYLMYDRMLRYHQARREFARSNPRQVLPPQFQIKQPGNYGYINQQIYDTDERLMRLDFAY